MTPSNLSIILGISILLSLPPAPAAADVPAAPADLADLASRERQLRTDVDDLLSAWVVAGAEDAGRLLAARITELLQPRTLRLARQDASPPPANQALSDDHATTVVYQPGDTDCTRVGNTLECVLRDHASR